MISGLWYVCDACGLSFCADGNGRRWGCLMDFENRAVLMPTGWRSVTKPRFRGTKIVDYISLGQACSDLCEIGLREMDVVEEIEPPRRHQTFKGTLGMWTIIVSEKNLKTACLALAQLSVPAVLEKGYGGVYTEVAARSPGIVWRYPRVWSGIVLERVTLGMKWSRPLTEVLEMRNSTL